MKKKIVFICNSVTLAHPVRVTLLANMLDPEKYDIVIYRGKAYESILPHTTISVHPALSMNTKDFLECLSDIKSPFDKETIKLFAEEELKILEIEKPDLVIGDFRYTLQVTARQRSVPYLNLTNAVWDPLFALKLEPPPTRRFTFLPDYIKAWLMNHMPKIAFLKVNHAFNTFLKQNGFLPYKSDPRLIFSNADYNAYCDLSAFFPPNLLDHRHCFIGPILWSPNMPAPDLSTLRANGKYTVYINLGSSGDANILEPLCAKLSDDDINLIVATGTSPAPPALLNRPNTIVMPYLASDKISSQVDAVICNGGMPTACTALLNNAYCVGVVSNLDQMMGMRQIERKGAGRCFRSRPYDINGIVSTIKARPTLSPDLFKELTNNYNQNRPEIIFPKFIDQILSNEE